MVKVCGSEIQLTQAGKKLRRYPGAILNLDVEEGEPFGNCQGPPSSLVALQRTFSNRSERKTNAKLNHSLAERVIGRVVVVGCRGNDAGATRTEIISWSREVGVVQRVHCIEADLQVSGFMGQWNPEVLTEREVYIL